MGWRRRATKRVRNVNRRRGASPSFVILRSCKLSNFLLYYHYYGFVGSCVHETERELVYKATRDAVRLV